MPNQDPAAPPSFGSENLRLPDELRVPVKEHLAYLREQYPPLLMAEIAKNLGNDQLALPELRVFVCEG